MTDLSGTPRRSSRKRAQAEAIDANRSSSVSPNEKGTVSGALELPINASHRATPLFKRPRLKSLVAQANINCLSSVGNAHYKKSSKAEITDDSSYPFRISAQVKTQDAEATPPISSKRVWEEDKYFVVQAAAPEALPSTRRGRLDSPKARRDGALNFAPTGEALDNDVNAVLNLVASSGILPSVGGITPDDNAMSQVIGPLLSSDGVVQQLQLEAQGAIADRPSLWSFATPELLEDPIVATTSPRNPPKTTTPSYGLSEAASSLESQDSGKFRATDVANPLEEYMKPVTDEERRLFKGFVEVESEPALFEYILQRNGVKSVRIRELYDVSTLANESDKHKVHGLVFLFPYGANDGIENDDAPKCPRRVWFANQVVENACATVALLNIIMNCPDVELGHSLDCFKQRTMKLKPPYRGLEIGNSASIRINHNSFMRRMELLNADLVLSNQFDKYIRAKKSKRAIKVVKNSKSSAKPRPLKSRPKDEYEEAYHYIAYVPVGPDVWKLDGLLKQPVNIGPCGENWLSTVQNNMVARIAQDGRPQYNLMALSEDPLKGFRQGLAQTLKSIGEVEKVLDDMMDDWKAFGDFVLGSAKEEVMASCGVTQMLINEAEVHEGVMKVLKGGAPYELLSLRKILASDQVKLEGEYMTEVANAAAYSEIVASRLRDPTPAFVRSFHELSEMAVLKDIARKVGSRRNSSNSLGGF